MPSCPWVTRDPAGATVLWIGDPPPTPQGRAGLEFPGPGSLAGAEIVLHPEAPWVCSHRPPSTRGPAAAVAVLFLRANSLCQVSPSELGNWAQTVMPRTRAFRWCKRVIFRMGGLLKLLQQSKELWVWDFPLGIPYLLQLSSSTPVNRYFSYLYFESALLPCCTLSPPHLPVRITCWGSFALSGSVRTTAVPLVRQTINVTYGLGLLCPCGRVTWGGGQGTFISTPGTPRWQPWRPPRPAPDKVKGIWGLLDCRVTGIRTLFLLLFF